MWIFVHVGFGPDTRTHYEIHRNEKSSSVMWTQITDRQKSSSNGGSNEEYNNSNGTKLQNNNIQSFIHSDKWDSTTMYNLYIFLSFGYILITHTYLCFFFFLILLCKDENEQSGGCSSH